MPDTQQFTPFDYGATLTPDQAQYLVDRMGEQQAIQHIRQNRQTVPHGWLPDPKRAIELKKLEYEGRRTAATENRTFGLPRPKAGYMWDPTGSRQIPIKGGQEWYKLRRQHAEDLGTYNLTDLAVTNATDKVNALLDERNKEDLNSLFGGYNAWLFTQWFPGGTQDMKATLESLKSDMKNAGLELLRRGGSVGQITEREWPIIERMIDSLTPMMSEDRARNTLKRIRVFMNRLRDNAATKYEESWKGTDFSTKIDKGRRTLEGWRQFNTEEDAQKAADQGIISDGDTIIVGGRKATWSDK